MSQRLAGFTAACLLAAIAPDAGARTFYVSPGGSDRARGTSASQPWRTVARVNRARLRPGDTVLLRGRATFGHTLMPHRSGRPGTPIRFASYGRGRARLRRGVWFGHGHDLVFDRLALPGASFVGHGDRVTVTHSAVGRGRMGIYAEGTDWWIAANKVHRTGDSGVILVGAKMTVAWNRIERTGLDSGIPYAKHGVYVRAAHARVLGNLIRGFESNGVSARRHGGVIEGNRIDHGPIGIAWFQNDSEAGTSSWTDNRITRTTEAAIYVSPADTAGPTRERFVIARNVLRPLAGRGLDLRGLRGSSSS